MDCDVGRAAPTYLARRGKRELLVRVERRCEEEVIALFFQYQRQGSSSQCRTKGPLTRREMEVLSWLARGKSNWEIAVLMEIRPATVGKHLEHIYPKLGVENRTSAATFAHR